RPAGHLPPAFFPTPSSLSEALVRAVAIGRILASLAAAEIGGSALLGGERRGRETRVLVRAVAEWLVGGLSAGAPVIGLACFEFLRKGPLLGDDRFSHLSPFLQ